MDTPLCISCKKFYGNPSTENMCSKCFNQMQATTRNLNTVQDIAKTVQNSPPMAEETKVAQTASPDRCAQCKKKLNLLPFRCSCGSYFCAAHRQPEQHSCTFDYKTVGIRKLSEENPLVQAEKLNRL